MIILDYSYHDLTKLDMIAIQVSHYKNTTILLIYDLPQARVIMRLSRLFFHMWVKIHI